jgi:hypothetical protein
MSLQAYEKGTGKPGRPLMVEADNRTQGLVIGCRVAMDRAQLIKICLIVLAFASLSVGVPAILVPEAFFDDYPFFTAWVGLLPPYNEHLVTDVGGLYLGFGIMFLWALRKPSRQLILPLCSAWLVVQAIHFFFHVGHLGDYSTFEAVSQTVGLTVILLASLFPVLILGPRR